MKKKLTLKGAVRGVWGGGKPGRGALVGRRLDRELGGAAVPAEGEAGGGVLGTPGIGPAGRRLGCAAPSWRGPGRRAALTAAARRRRCSDPGSAPRGGAPVGESRVWSGRFPRTAL